LLFHHVGYGFTCVEQKMEKETWSTDCCLKVLLCLFTINDSENLMLRFLNSQLFEVLELFTKGTSEVVSTLSRRGPSFRIIWIFGGRTIRWSHGLQIEFLTSEQCTGGLTMIA
jgi:hypothetical protein